MISQVACARDTTSSGHLPALTESRRSVCKQCVLCDVWRGVQVQRATPAWVPLAGVYLTCMASQSHVYTMLSHSAHIEYTY